MGDCGQYDGSVHVEYSLRKKEKNTQEDCNKFITDKGFTIISAVEATEKEIQSLYERNSVFTLEYRDWESWTSKDTSLEDMLEALKEYGYNGEDGYSIIVYRPAITEDVEYLDFDLAKDMCCISANLRTNTMSLLSVGDSIYCENDNSSEDSMAAKDILKYLNLPDARIVLIGDGNGNC